MLFKCRPHWRRTGYFFVWAMSKERHSNTRVNACPRILAWTESTGPRFMGTSYNLKHTDRYTLSNMYMSRNFRKMTFWHNSAPDEDSNHPAHPRRLIRVFVVRMKKLSFFGYLTAPNEDSYQTAQMRSLIWIFSERRCPKVRFLTLWLIQFSLQEIIYYIFIIVSFLTVCLCIICENRVPIKATREHEGSYMFYLFFISWSYNQTKSAFLFLICSIFLKNPYVRIFCNRRSCR